VVCDGTTARVRKVAIGNRGDEGVEITEGVKAGEQVVIDHVLGLSNDQPLAIASPGSAGARSSPGGSAESIASPGSAGARSSPGGSAESIAGQGHAAR
jgi:hypothetical protein